MGKREGINHKFIPPKRSRAGDANCVTVEKGRPPHHQRPSIRPAIQRHSRKKSQSISIGGPDDRPIIPPSLHSAHSSHHPAVSNQKSNIFQKFKKMAPKKYFLKIQIKILSPLCTLRKEGRKRTKKGGVFSSGGGGDGRAESDLIDSAGVVEDPV